MSTSSWCVKLLLLAAAIALLVAAPWRDARDENPFAGRGYTTKVNEVLVAQELLQTDGRTIVLSDRGRSDRRIVEFFERSRLREDAKDANSGIWRIENNRIIGIEPSAHDIPLPSRERIRWRGSIQFREPGAASSRYSLVGEFGSFVFAQPDFQRPELSRSRVLVPLFGQTGQRMSGPVALLQVTDPRNSFDIAEVMMWGDTPVVGAYSEGPFSVYVDGELLRRDHRRGMLAGGTLEVRSNNGLTTTLRSTQEVELASTISSYRPWQARQRAAGYERAAEAIESAMTRAVANDPDRVWETRDLSLTLDQGLDAGLREMVTNLARRHQEDWARHVIAVTIMDAMTGDILAFSSSESPADNSGAIDANFRRLQVGSAAKPLITAAILQDRPDLVDLVVQPSGVPDGEGHLHLPTLLGVEMSQTNTLGSSVGGPCNFDCFLQHSDNKFAAALMLLASTAQGEEQVATGETYRIGQRVYQTRPLSRFERIGGDGRPRFQTGRVVMQVDWDHNLADLFDLDYQTAGGVESDGDERCSTTTGRWGDDSFDMRIWRNVFAVSARSNPCAFRQISPWRENFKLDQQRDFEQGMLLTMIGGGEAAWTNFKLAESYARLVTGREIAASLALADSSAEPEQVGEFLLNPVIRRRITHALTLVPQGTASWPALDSAMERTRAELNAQDSAFGFFAKTGTPQLEIHIQGPEPRAIHRLIAEGAVALERSGSGLLEVRASGGAWLATRANRRAMIAALTNDPRPLVQAAISQEHSSIVHVVDRLIRENSGGVERIERDFSSRGNLLFGMTGYDQTRDEWGKVFVFAAVRYPGAAGLNRGYAVDAMANPERAFIVVINIQNSVEQDKKAAVNLGAEILDRLIRPRLARPLRGVRRP